MAEELGRRPSTMVTLINKGLAKEGQPIYLLHKLPKAVKASRSDPRFRGKLKIKGMKATVIWERDGEEWSLSGSAIKVINEARPSAPRKTAVGPSHWGTEEKSFLEMYKDLEESPAQH